MNVRTLCFAFSVATLVGLFAFNGGAQKLSAPLKPKAALALKPRHVADALRAVILSDREVYTKLVAEHQEEFDSASQTGLAKKRLPSPCEMLRLASQTMASKGVEYSYVLRSLDPLNKRNAPETEIETKGLQFVRTRPDLMYSSEERLGGRRYFTAVYPDVAVVQSCVTCHNEHPASIKKDFKLGDVMGGLVIRIALDL